MMKGSDIKMYMYKRHCETCIHCFIDDSVGYYQCVNEDLTETELEKYFTNGEDGCPHYEEEDYTEENEYYEGLMNMPCDTYGMAACSHSCPKYYQCQG